MSRAKKTIEIFAELNFGKERLYQRTGCLAHRRGEKEVFYRKSRRVHDVPTKVKEAKSRQWVKSMLENFSS